MRAFIREVRRRPVLTRGQEVALAKRAKAGDTAARHRLVEANLRLVVWFAQQQRGSGLPLSELIQEGVIGLLKAVDQYDYRRGYRFATYAGWRIRGAQRTAAEQNRDLITLSRLASSRLQLIVRAEEELRQAFGRDPSTNEIAERIGVPSDEVSSLRRHRRPPISLDMLKEGDTISDSEEWSVLDTVYDRTAKTLIAKALASLSSRERTVIELRFGLGSTRSHTLTEIGDALRLSHEGVRLIEKRTLSKLRLLLTESA